MPLFVESRESDFVLDPSVKRMVHLDLSAVMRAIRKMGMVLFAIMATCARGNSVAGETEPQPFVRDVQTGYLLNYCFLSPRPYCWKNDDCLLSGWEVDRRGGRFEFSPNGRPPEGFRFHNDWFKLVNAKANSTITIKHQFARQTAGKLTWEFRFKLTTKMDGACWQLRDLQTAGVSLTTADGKLWCESVGGKSMMVQQLEVGHDYGVKVIANLDTKKVSVFVDGQLKADAVSFVSPIQAMDYVLVKTGETVAGEMFLNPVNIFKGYHVNETFITSGVGTLPSDWNAASGMAMIEPFECGTKPDIFSLKLAGSADKPAAVTKNFEPATGKTVWQYSFLLPEKCDGARAELSSVDKSGLRIITKGGDLCFDNGKDRIRPLVHNYRANLWYAIKVIADPKMGTADVFVNGKLTAEGETYVARQTAFNQLRFAATGLMWVDDIQVYPRLDYPADYVPAPKPQPTRNGAILGVQCCSLWREGLSYAGWDYIYPQRAHRKPYLGWYDEGNPEVTDWEIKWQVEHGVGFEMYCWYRPNNAVNHPIKDGVLDHGIIKGLFNARYGKLMKFAIMCTNEGACETNMQDWRENIIPYWIEYFFKDPRYLKIDGKPVVSIWHLGNWRRMFGGADASHQSIQILRDEVKKAGFPGIIVLMQLHGADGKALKEMKQMGIDYCFTYTAGSDALRQRENNLAQRDAAAAAGFKSLPSISMGWEAESWGSPGGDWLSPRDFASLAQWARDEFMPSIPADSLGRRILLLNWNEFGEGHFLMPTTLVGFGYLDALRKVFTDGGTHEDITPTDMQQRRFNVLYPKN